MGHHTDVFYEAMCQGGLQHHFGESANLPEKVSCNMVYRSDSPTTSRNMGTLSFFDFRSENEMFAVSFAKPFAFASEFLRNA